VKRWLMLDACMSMPTWAETALVFVAYVAGMLMGRWTAATPPVAAERAKGGE